MEAAQLDRIAAQVRDSKKVNLYKKHVENGVCDFEAIAHETYGAMGAQYHLKRLGAITAASGKGSKGIFMRNTVLALSMALQRGNGLVIRKGEQE